MIAKPESVEVPRRRRSISQPPALTASQRLHVSRKTVEPVVSEPEGKMARCVIIVALLNSVDLKLHNEHFPSDSNSCVMEKQNLRVYKKREFSED